MRISVLGTGRMGKGLIRTLAGHQAHHTLLWASRSLEKANELIEQNELKGVTAATYEEAVKADIIIHSMWFRDLIPWARQNKEKLEGKILVDIVNPFTEDFNDFTTDWNTSAAEELQKALPKTRVVGSFKNTFFKVFDSPRYNGLLSDVYVTSDDDEAKAIVLNALSALDGTSFRLLDGGKLINNRTIERMTLFEREVSIRYGSYPYVSFHMFGLPK